MPLTIYARPYGPASRRSRERIDGRSYPDTGNATSTSYATLEARWVGGYSDAIPLTRPVIRIGRRADCDIIIDHPAISNQHLEVSYHDGGLYVRDLASRSGSYLNGNRLPDNRLVPVLTDTTVRLHNALDLRLLPPEALWQGLAMPPHVTFASHPLPGLMVCQWGGLLQRIMLADRRVRLGSHPDNDIVLTGSDIAEYHAEILAGPGGQYRLVDLAGRAGVRFNGQSVKAKTLRAGDQLFIGDQVLLQFEPALNFFSLQPPAADPPAAETPAPSPRPRRAPAAAQPRGNMFQSIITSITRGRSR